MKKFLLASVISISVGVMGLVTYSFFMSRGPATPGSSLSLEQLVLRTSRAAFIDEGEELNPQKEAPLPGYLAPDFLLEGLEGEPRRLSDFRGTPVLVNFWTTWCPPCRAEAPDLQRFHEEFGEEMVLIGVNWGESPREVRSFTERFGQTYLQLLDREGEAFVKYRLTGIPTSFFIDERGVIRGIWYGAMKYEEMVAAFRTTTRHLEDRP